jgi:hypothetical protein
MAAAETIDKRLVRHESYPEMFWVTWSDGDTDFYNRTWAVEHLRRMDENTVRD